MSAHDRVRKAQRIAERLRSAPLAVVQQLGLTPADIEWLCRSAIAFNTMSEAAALAHAIAVKSEDEPA